MADRAFKLGLLAPLSGVVALYGEEIIRAARIAVDEVNQNGGVLGQPLELVVEDDGSIPDTAVPAAEKLAKEDGCIALIGCLLSNSRISVVNRVADPLKIPLLNFSFYEGSILSRYFFNFAALPNQQIDKMIPYMASHFGPKMFFAGNNYEWPRGSIDAAKKVLLSGKGEVVGEEYFEMGSEDFDDLLARVTRSGADVFVPYAAGMDQLNLLTRFYEKGLKERMAVVMGHYDEAMVQFLTPEVRENLFSSNTYFMAVDTKENQEYLRKLRQFDGVTALWPDGNGVLTNFGEGTYLCVKAFAQAVNSCGSANQEVIIDALAAVNLKGPQGNVSMNADTHHASVNSYLAKCNRDGKFSIVESFGCIPPEIPARYQHMLNIDNRTGCENDGVSDAKLDTTRHSQLNESRAELSTTDYDSHDMHRLLSLVDAAIVAVSEDGTITYVNEGTSLQFGYPIDELVGLSVHLLVPPHYRSEHKNHFNMFMSSDQNRILMSARGEITAYRKDGSFFPAEASISKFDSSAGKVAVVTIMDLTERKSNEQAILHDAMHDPLTGLPNRVLIKERLDRAVLRATRADTFLAVFFIDLDRFKLVNDNYGHEVGDTLLVKASERMLSVVRPGDTVGRFGGDEFVVICDQLSNLDIADTLAKRIVDIFKEPIKFEYGELFSTASVGVAVYQGGDETAESMLRKADTAMYYSKEMGRDQWQPYSEQIGAQVKSQLSVSNGLRSAIERDEMFLQYQPIIDVASRKMVGVEALIRWNGPDGVVRPDIFIPIAELNGTILPIGKWVFEQACLTLKRWINRFGEALTPYMSINLSARQLVDEDIVEQFIEITKSVGVPADKIVLEVTETSLVTDVEINLAKLTALNKLGIKIAIDDFGTGYSSMGQLKLFSVDILKIDKSFVDHIEQSEDDYAIAAAIIHMSRALGIAVTAEGVESEGQLQILEGLGCCNIQGYLFSRPQAVEGINGFLDGSEDLSANIKSPKSSLILQS